MSLPLPQCKTTVIIPTYNNPKTITKVAQDVIEHGYELIIVDDGSYSNVDDLIKPHPKITILRHETNLGKGQAILTGAKKAKELGYEYFVTMDGDGQHLAREIYKLLEARTEHKQLVVGARNFEIDNVPVKSKAGRAFHNFCVRINCGYDISDSLTGFRLYPVSILDLDINTKGFSFEIEVLVKHYRKYKNITDTTIECYYPTPEERVSHFDNYKDTIRFVLMHFKLFFLKFNNYLFLPKTTKD